MLFSWVSGLEIRVDGKFSNGFVFKSFVSVVVKLIFCKIVPKRKNESTDQDIHGGNKNNCVFKDMSTIAKWNLDKR